MPANDQDQDNETRHDPNLILDVENFGPIAEAKNVEFRPMTVFVGPSNTGKSYLARLLHAILRAKNGDSLRPDAIPPSVAELFDSVDQSALNEYVSEIQTFVETQSDRRSTVMHFDQMSKNLKRFVASATKNWLKSLATRSICEVEHYFQRDLKQIITGGSGDAPMLTRAFTYSREWLMTFSSDFEFHTTSIGNIDLIIDDRFRFNLSRYDDRYTSRRQRIEFYLLNALDESIAARMNAFARSHYALAGRTGILSSRAVLTGVILANLNTALYHGLEIRQLDPIAGELLSSLAGDASTVDQQMARRMRRTSRQRAGMPRIADLMESTMLNGRIESRSEFDNGSYDFVTESFRGPLEFASSMVTEIAPLVLSVRNRVRKDELLIIDEPEAHLHPEAQQRMAATLTYLVRRGVRVLITTHSHYMVEAMGMFVCASGIGDEARVRSMGEFMGEHRDDRGDIRHELYLNEDEVAIYGFKERDGAGTVVEPIPFDPESYSYSPKDYAVALLDQFNRISRVINERIDADELATNA